MRYAYHTSIAWMNTDTSLYLLSFSSMSCSVSRISDERKIVRLSTRSRILRYTMCGCFTWMFAKREKERNSSLNVISPWLKRSLKCSAFSSSTHSTSFPVHRKEKRSGVPGGVSTLFSRCSITYTGRCSCFSISANSFSMKYERSSLFFFSPAGLTEE